MALRAIIFGSIGTLVETSDLQRTAFNAAFDEAGLGWDWDSATYRSLVADGASGGAARIAAYAADRGEALSTAAAAGIHARKSAILQQRMTDDGVPPRPGVVDLIAEARAAGLTVAMASTTSKANIDAIFAATAPALTREMFDVVTCETDAARGKPAPDVYLEVLRRLGLRADEAVAIEDTRQSLASPRAAGIATLVVPGEIAGGQDFGDAPVTASLAGYGGLAALRGLIAATV